ncbi:hypothetical protein HQR03_09450 [Psychrobacter okhotskensis]|uniref:hypothetical protein n=1 Tax=Psychrobacter okhotskensis TaxID=212403 RepID=UPI00156517AB|nr:hypothetical protein [Psychrobacter okhotskensis]NRD70757.1 hypothetical protein [Psychrobacter okhotskensis]
MIRLSYTLKCWALSIVFYSVFYFAVLMTDPDFGKYNYMLALSTLLFPISKRAIDVLSDSLRLDFDMFDGFLSPLLINITIWIFTPFIVFLTLIAFLAYSMGVMKRNLNG